MCIIFRKLTIVCYERESAQKSRNLSEKKIIAVNCLLWEKDKIKFIEKIKCVQKKRNLLVD